MPDDAAIPPIPPVPQTSDLILTAPAPPPPVAPVEAIPSSPATDDDGCPICEEVCIPLATTEADKAECKTIWTDFAAKRISETEVRQKLEAKYGDDWALRVTKGLAKGGALAARLDADEPAPEPVLTDTEESP